MIKKYLEERKEILYETISKNRKMFEHNEIAIAETKNKIEEIKENEDAASKLFSVKTRENAQYKTEEMIELEQQVAIMEEENVEYRTEFEKAEKELKVVEKCFEEIEKELKVVENCFEEIENVSRETFVTESVREDAKIKQTIDTDIKSSDIMKKEGFDKTYIVRQLEFCRGISQVDTKRVYIELDNLIRNLK